jgi:hypothetical protein
MADPREIDEVFDALTANYGSPNGWPVPKTRDLWYSELRDYPAEVLMDVASAIMRTPEKYPPKIGTMLGMLAKVGAKGESVGPTGPRACPDCHALPGLREMAIQWVEPRGKHEARVVVAACECRLGEARKASGATGWRDVWASWQRIRDRLVADGGRVVGGPWRTHRDMPRLTDAQRFTPEDLERWPRKNHGQAVAHVFAALNGRDQHAYQRARQIERDGERDEWEGEEAS